MKCDLTAIWCFELIFSIQGHFASQMQSGFNEKSGFVGMVQGARVSAAVINSIYLKYYKHVKGWDVCCNFSSEVSMLQGEAGPRGHPGQPGQQVRLRGLIWTWIEGGITNLMVTWHQNSVNFFFLGSQRWSGNPRRSWRARTNGGNSFDSHIVFYVWSWLDKHLDIWDESDSTVTDACLCLSAGWTGSSRTWWPTRKTRTRCKSNIYYQFIIESSCCILSLKWKG